MAADKPLVLKWKKWRGKPVAAGTREAEAHQMLKDNVEVSICGDTVLVVDRDEDGLTSVYDAQIRRVLTNF